MIAASIPAGTARTSPGWHRHVAALAMVAAALLALFARDAVSMVSTWWTSTTFGHCFLIPPIIGWLVWQRRGELARLQPVAWAPGLAIVAVGAAAWLTGQAATVTFARQLGLVVMIGGAVVTLLGPVVARGLAFPLFYALFAVPFGEWMETPLQAVTVRLVMPLLAVAGVPAVSDGVVIHAGRYWFEVAEACSGAKFVIAMVAFGALVANLCYRSWRRRIPFLAACVIVPVLANGVRAFATIWIADLTSVETAAGIDHVVYGWIWFGVVMAAMLAIGWRWFDRAADEPAFDPAAIARPVRRRLAIGPAAALVLGIAAAAPTWSALAATRGPALPARLYLPAVADWHRAPLSGRAAWQPLYPGADHRLIGRYADDAGHVVDVAIAAFARQRQGGELVAYGTGADAGGDWLRASDLPPIAGGAAERIRAPGPVLRIVASWYRVGDTITTSPAMVKLLTLRARLMGGDQRAVALHLSVETGDEGQARTVIAAFLTAAGPPGRIGDEVMRGS